MINREVCERLSEICDASKSNLVFDEPLSRHTTISIGGIIKAWYEPSSLDELIAVRKLLKTYGVETIVVGNGSNFLFPDSAVDAVAISLRDTFFANRVINGGHVEAGAGLGLGNLVSFCAEKGFTGLEGLIGIPASVGGALFMNASYQISISDFLVRLCVLDKDNNIRWIDKTDIDFRYRHSSIARSDIIIEAIFSLNRGDVEELKDKVSSFLSEKLRKQPLDRKSLGCVFKNPESGACPSGMLIDKLGMKGYRRGGAEISRKHANFIINADNATSQDVMLIMEDIKKKAREELSIDLEAEIQTL